MPKKILLFLTILFAHALLINSNAAGADHNLATIQDAPPPPPRVLIESDSYNSPTAATSDAITEGTLSAVNDQGQTTDLCTLKHTDVKAEISGLISRVTVRQEFVNSLSNKIEAVYTFPLPPNAAVDEMSMHVGAERTIRGKIMRRTEAQEIYEQARAEGRLASLLNQERPNIFTQSIANLEPGERLTIEISYVEMLKYEDGLYEFVFPMVVGPRYLPASGSVKDAPQIMSTLSPSRAGHDISLEVVIDGGLPVEELRSTLHDIEVSSTGADGLLIKLKDRDEIPNRDFILKYRTAGEQINDALLAHRDGRGGFFTLVLQPPMRVAVEDVAPKELVFVLDTSGSMSGAPIEKAKETMSRALAALHPRDTFNLITFSGDTRILFDQPVPATTQNLQRAQDFLAASTGDGGTEMMTAIRAALAPSDAEDHIRIVCFMTDGYVGNDFEILSEIQKHPNARVFSFGIGDSPNRYLLDKMAVYGRGAAEYVTLDDSGAEAARRFEERVRSPLLTDISIDWGSLSVMNVYPRRIPDLFSAQPIVLTGRYQAGGSGIIRLRGKMAGRAFSQEINIELPDSEVKHDVLASLWARQRIEDLMSRDLTGLQGQKVTPEIEEAITKLGLEYRLMTQFTSFVAVEEKLIRSGSELRRIEVPVEMPEGMNGVGSENYVPGNATANAFTQSEMIKNIGPVALSVMSILFIMSLCVVYVTCKYIWIGLRNGLQSRRFVPRLARALKDERLNEVLSLTKSYPHSHHALVVGAGLYNLCGIERASLSTEQKIILSRSAQERAIAIKSAEFRRGLSGLATIGSTAPFVGLFGTVFGIISAFTGMKNAESAGIGAVAGGIAEALLTTALGLAVAVPAVWVFNYFSNRSKRFEMEMSCAASEMCDYFLKAHAQKLKEKRTSQLIE